MDRLRPLPEPCRGSDGGNPSDSEDARRVRRAGGSCSAWRSAAAMPHPRVRTFLETRLSRLRSLRGDRVLGARRIALLQCVSDRAPAVRTGLRSYMLQNRSFGRRAAPFAAEQKLRPGVSSTSVSPNGSRTRKRRGIAAKNPILPRMARDRLSGSAPRSHGHAHAWLVIRAQRRQPAAHAVAHAWLARCRWRRRCRRRQSHAHARFARALGRLTHGG